MTETFSFLKPDELPASEAASSSWLLMAIRTFNDLVHMFEGIFHISLLNFFLRSQKGIVF